MTKKDNQAKLISAFGYAMDYYLCFSMFLSTKKLEEKLMKYVNNKNKIATELYFDPTFNEQFTFVSRLFDNLKSEKTINIKDFGANDHEIIMNYSYLPCPPMDKYIRFRNVIEKINHIADQIKKLSSYSASINDMLQAVLINIHEEEYPISELIRMAFQNESETPLNISDDDEWTRYEPQESDSDDDNEPHIIGGKTEKLLLAL